MKLKQCAGGFIKAPKEILSAKINPTAKLVYLLLSNINFSLKIDRKFIAETLGVSVRSVGYAILELEKAGFLLDSKNKVLESSEKNVENDGEKISKNSANFAENGDEKTANFAQKVENFAENESEKTANFAQNSANFAETPLIESRLNKDQPIASAREKKIAGKKNSQNKLAKKQKKLDFLKAQFSESELKDLERFYAYRRDESKNRSVSINTKLRSARDLLALKQQGQSVEAVVNQSIDKLWLGLFSVKNGRGGFGGNGANAAQNADKEPIFPRDFLPKKSDVNLAISNKIADKLDAQGFDWASFRFNERDLRGVLVDGKAVSYGNQLFFYATA